MIPEYAFKLGVDITPSFQADKLNNNVGRPVDSPGSWASYVINVSEIEGLYFDVFGVPSVTGIDILCFDSDQAFISNIGPQFKANTPLILPEGTQSIKLNLHPEFPGAGAVGKGDRVFVYGLYSCNPVYSKLSITRAKENKQLFLRSTLETDMAFYNKDFSLIMNQYVTTKFLLLIEGAYAGTFKYSDCTFDYDACKVTTKFTTLDQYTLLLQRLDKEVDLIKLRPKVTKVRMCYRPFYQIYAEGADSVTNIMSGTSWESGVAAEENPATLAKAFAFLGAAGEWEIKDGPEELKGIYAGLCRPVMVNQAIQGKYIAPSGYYILVTAQTPESTTLTIELVNPSGEGLYVGTASWEKDATRDEAGALYIGPGPEVIRLYKVGDTSQSIALENGFSYPLWGRMLTNNSLGKELPPNDFAKQSNNYKRFTTEVSMPFYCTSHKSEKPTRYGVDDYAKYFAPKPADSPYEWFRAVPAAKSSWVNSSIWFYYPNGYETVDAKYREYFWLNDCYSIADVIKALMDELTPGITHEASTAYSELLYHSFPQYITEQHYTLYLTPKSNALKGTYDQAAQKAPITWGNLVEMLYNCFRGCWFIEDGKLKVEHISYFDNPPNQLNLFNQIDQFNRRPALYFQSTIKYDTSNLPRDFAFSWMDDVTEIFGDPGVRFLESYVAEDLTEEVRATQFTADIDFMLADPDSFSKDGFALLAAQNPKTEPMVVLSSRQIRDEDGQNYKVLAQNITLSWLNLFEFQLTNLPWSSFKIDLSPKVLNPQGLRKTKSTTVQLPLPSDFDEAAEFCTTYYCGTAQKYTIDLITMQLSLTLEGQPF